jgi:hypothetical protein
LRWLEKSHLCSGVQLLLNMIMGELQLASSTLKRRKKSASRSSPRSSYDILQACQRSRHDCSSTISGSPRSTVPSDDRTQHKAPPSDQSASLRSTTRQSEGECIRKSMASSKQDSWERKRSWRKREHPCAGSLSSTEKVSKQGSFDNASKILSKSSSPNPCDHEKAVQPG